MRWRNGPPDPDRKIKLKKGKTYTGFFVAEVRAHNRRVRRRKPTIGRAREQRFVVHFAKRVVIAFMAKNGNLKPADIKLAAGEAAVDAGYRAPAHGHRLVRLPRIQNALEEAFAAAGLTLEHCAVTLASIVNDAKVDAAVKIKAIDLRFKVAGAYAPNVHVGKFQHEHHNADAMFDDSQMRTVGPPDPVELEDDESVRAARVRDDEGDARPRARRSTRHQNKETPSLRAASG